MLHQKLIEIEIDGADKATIVPVIPADMGTAAVSLRPGHFQSVIAAFA
jgi:hypothetical protein